MPVSWLVKAHFWSLSARRWRPWKARRTCSSSMDIHLTNARMDGLNSLFQAVRARTRGYQNTKTFITMIYMIASPAGSILKST
ncbi:transposase [Thiolapillus sp.]|uniref:transposase n=1 Tax=Thiolapillus sp. TaxID=2017437 RepID=UPI003AF9AC6D